MCVLGKKNWKKITEQHGRKGQIPKAVDEDASLRDYSQRTRTARTYDVRSYVRTTYMRIVQLFQCWFWSAFEFMCGGCWPHAFAWSSSLDGHFRCLSFSVLHYACVWHCAQCTYMHRTSEYEFLIFFCLPFRWPFCQARSRTQKRKT